MEEKEILQVDLDGVAAGFDEAWLALSEKDKFYENDEKKVPHEFFLNLPVIEGAVESIRELAPIYDIYFLSTPQWSNPACWMEKRIWVEKHFGELMFKRLTLTHHKGLVFGHYLIDDRYTNGVESFKGKHIHFGSKTFPNWKVVTQYLKECRDIYEVRKAKFEEGYKHFMETR